MLFSVSWMFLFLGCFSVSVPRVSWMTSRHHWNETRLLDGHHQTPIFLLSDSTPPVLTGLNSYQHFPCFFNRPSSLLAYGLGMGHSLCLDCPLPRTSHGGLLPVVLEQPLSQEVSLYCITLCKLQGTISIQSTLTYFYTYVFVFHTKTYTAKKTGFLIILFTTGILNA